MNTLLRLLLASLLLLLGSQVHAANTLSIAPSGTLSYVNNVHVVITAHFDQPAQTALGQVESFSVRFSGQDLTSQFLNAAQASFPDANTVSARVEYLFGPGTYTVSSSLKLQGQPAATAQTTFTVPGDDQERRKNTMLSKISLYIHQYDGHTFSDWISLGELSRFSTRLFEAPVQVYIDPSFNSDSDAIAQYVELYVWKQIWTVYEQDIVLSVEPEQFSVDGTNSSRTLWHETIHAISHGLQLAGSPTRLTADDHIYLYWAESCTDGLFYLGQFEDYVQQGGLSNPPASIAQQARNRWKGFVTACNRSAESRLPTDLEKAEFQSVTGFKIDPNDIKSRYLAAGVPAVYFDDLHVVLDDPTAAETPETTADLTGSYDRYDGGAVNDADITRAYFKVNGSERAAASYSSGTITGSVGLAQGDNRVQVVMVLAAGGEVASNTITIKSTNSVPITITLSWNKLGADVDLHLQNGSGSDCYYGNMHPDWGVQGSAPDDPQLDRDCITQCTIEHINLQSLVPGETYRVRVHYFSDHDKGPATAFVSVVVNGQSVFSASNTLSDGDNWDVFSYTNQ